jgi:hypothetical protein
VLFIKWDEISSRTRPRGFSKIKITEELTVEEAKK